MSFWKIVSPEAGTNKVLNPSAEAAGNFSAIGAGVTATRVNSRTRHGIYSYQIINFTGSGGISLTLSALANADHYVTLYFYRATSDLTISASTDGGANTNLMTALYGDPYTRMTRMYATIPAAQANGSVALRIVSSVSPFDNWHIDCVMVQEVGYLSTYIDGDQPGCRWSGIRHGSASTRSATERSGGRILDLYTDLGISVLTSSNGFGMPRIDSTYMPLALQDGAQFINQRYLPAEINLALEMTGSTWNGLHEKRQDLIDLLKSERTRGQQAFTVIYAGATRWVHNYFRLASGLEFGNAMGFTEMPTIRLVADDPYWYEDAQEITSVDKNTTITTNGVLGRINGTWQALGFGAGTDNGASGHVYAIKCDDTRNVTYISGDFEKTSTTPDILGVMVWSGGTDPTPIDATGGFNTTHKFARAIFVAPDGKVWFGGNFTTAAGGAAQTYLTLYDPTTNAFNTADYDMAGTFSIGTFGIRTLAMRSDTDVLYIGGDFLVLRGVVSADYIAKLTISTDAVSIAGFSPNNIVQDLAVDANDNLYVVGLFTFPHNYILKWDGTTTSAVGTVNARINTIEIDDAGNLYIGGNFTSPGNYVAKWNGNSYETLGNGLGGEVYQLRWINGLLYARGAFTTATGTIIGKYLAVWNGSDWLSLDVDPTGANADVLVMDVNSYGDIFIGGKFTGATTAKVSTVTTNSTGITYPYVVIFGPTSSGATANVLRIENQTTNEVLYLDFTLSKGDAAVVDLRRGSKAVYSLWQGRSNVGGVQNPTGLRVIPDQPIAGSDTGSFHLQPGANTVAVFCTGTTTGMAVYFVNDIRHLSVDGGA